ncbi:hypothetical protein FHS85_002882 [Rhodoligotrophos appendicifer]|uniref:DUF192 domain-containing protein n=1 Tax=Rhodoligotrophos appendicifer TaxID=987056 RepID=UPI001FEB7DDB|nr:DUF192 domain-containing protein [Rhodoligotrophos appendicifer]
MTRSRWFRRASVPVVLVLMAAFLWVQQAHAQEAANADGTEPVTLATDSGYVVIAAEVARTSAQKQQGLMNRDSLPEGRGMLFIWDSPAPVTMWMRNTRIPLDMIFITEHGLVHRIVENTVPFSEEFISSHGDVLAVLEVRAGVSHRVGLRPGHKVHHSTFEKK